jgi:hypothetical protein
MFLQPTSFSSLCELYPFQILTNTEISDWHVDVNGVTAEVIVNGSYEAEFENKFTEPHRK